MELKTRSFFKKRICHTAKRVPTFTKLQNLNEGDGKVLSLVLGLPVPQLRQKKRHHSSSYKGSVSTRRGKPCKNVNLILPGCKNETNDWAPLRNKEVIDGWKRHIWNLKEKDCGYHNKEEQVNYPRTLMYVAVLEFSSPNTNQSF